MAKWLVGLVGAVITGSVLWFLTDALFPKLFHEEKAPQPDEIRVECIPTPPTIAPGEVTELLVKVTRNGVPVEGAAVYFKREEAKDPARTVSGGIYRFPWRAPNPSASAYIFPVYADLAGVRTPQGELFGFAGTDCQVLVR